MAKTSETSPAAEPPPAPERARRSAMRRATAERKLRILERLTMGASVAHIARVEKITIRRVRQIIAEMLAKARGRSARRLRSVADRPARRRDGRRAYDDDGGRSSGDGIPAPRARFPLCRAIGNGTENGAQVVDVP